MKKLAFVAIILLLASCVPAHPSVGPASSPPFSDTGTIHLECVQGYVFAVTSAGGIAQVLGASAGTSPLTCP